MSENEWKGFAEKISGHLPSEAATHRWQKYPELLANRLKDALVRGPEAVEEWAVFFENHFGYKLNPLEVTVGVKPPYPCVSIVVPKDEMMIEKWKRDNPHNTCSVPSETPRFEVYKKCLEIFPYSRWTPQPQHYNFFESIDDCCERPPKPYLIWVRIPNFSWQESKKVVWEQLWDNPGPTLLEHMLLDLFWWDKYKAPIGINRDEGWKRQTSDICSATSTLCSGSEIREGRWPNEKYHKEFCGNKRLILTADWGMGGWYISWVGYKSATTPSPEPCFVSY